MEVKAAVMVRPGKMEVRHFPYPTVGDDDLVVKVEMCGLCGTDQHLWLGELDARYPVIPGHETIARVHKIGKNAAKELEVQGNELAEGDRVGWSNSIPCGKCYGCRWLAWPKASFCTSGETYGFDNCEAQNLKPWLYGGYSEFMFLKPKTWVYKIPDEVPTDVAVLMDTLVSIRGVESNMSIAPSMREGFSLLDTVVIQGAGPVGVMAAFKAKALGAGKIVMIGGPESRLKLAKEFGVDETINIEDTKKPEDRIERIMTLTDRIGADMVVECAGFPAAVPEGIELCRMGGMYVLIGCWANRGPIGIDPSRIVTRELHIVGQRYSSPQQYGRDLKLLAKYTNVFPFQKLITNKFKLEEAVTALETQNKFQGMKLVIAP